MKGNVPSLMKQLCQEMEGKWKHACDYCIWMVWFTCLVALDQVNWNTVITQVLNLLYGFHVLGDTPHMYPVLSD